MSPWKIIPIPKWGGQLTTSLFLVTAMSWSAWSSLPIVKGSIGWFWVIPAISLFGMAASVALSFGWTSSIRWRFLATPWRQKQGPIWLKRRALPSFIPWQALNLLLVFRAVLAGQSLWMLVPTGGKSPISWFLPKFWRQQVMWWPWTIGNCALAIGLPSYRKMGPSSYLPNLPSNLETTWPSSRKWIAWPTSASSNNR